MSNQNNPLVSVAVVTYKHKEFIGACLDSILEQDYSPIEIVVSDDGSNDGNQEILKQYAASHAGKFVLRLSSVNRGITANCNEALSACSGKYVAWLGGDDLMLPGKIRKQVEYMERNPQCSISYHNVEVFDSATMKTINRYNNRWNSYEGGAEVAVKYGTFNCACSNMVRRGKSPLHGFDPDIKVASDWYYWVEVLLNGGTINYLPEVLGKYRRHASNVTDRNNAFFKIALDDDLRSCEKILNRVPEFERSLRYRLSVIYRLRRRIDYVPNLVKSLRLNPLNWRSLAMLCIFYVTLGRIRY